ncbi:unnamed protein product, partial [Chrysoparadoxa australica]
SGLVAARQLTQLAILSSTTTLPGQESLLRPIYTGCIPHLYHLMDIEALDHPRDFAPVKKALQGKEWIWVGDQFVGTERVATECPANAKPYLHQVPPDLAGCTALLEALEVRETFSPRDFVGVLSDLYRAQSTSGLLSTAQQALAVAMIMLLSKLSPQEIQQLRGTTTYCPSREGVMVRATELIFDDTPWLSSSLVKSRATQLRYVHSAIPNAAAASVGVRSLRQ